MLILAIIGGVFGGLCVLYAFFWIIAESLGWALRYYGSTPMWRIKSKKKQNRVFPIHTIVRFLSNY